MPTPPDVSAQILKIAANTRTAHIAEVLSALRAGPHEANLVWNFQPPTSSDKGEWNLFHATSAGTSKFQKVKLFPVTMPMNASQQQRVVTMENLTTCARTGVKCKIALRHIGQETKCVTKINKAIVAVVTGGDVAWPLFSLHVNCTLYTIHGPPPYLTCPESFSRDTLAFFAQQRARMPRSKQA